MRHVGRKKRSSPTYSNMNCQADNVGKYCGATFGTGGKDREHLVNILQAHVEQQKAQEWKKQAAQQQFGQTPLEVLVLIRP